MKNSAPSTNVSSSNNSKNNKTSKMKKTNIPAQAVAQKKAFTYEKKSVDPSTLQIHPALLAVGALVSNDVFVEFYNEFNFLESPVVTEDRFVITHAADVLGAQHLGMERIEVVVMNNSTQDNVIRFISFKNVISHGKNKGALSQMVKYLTEHLTTTESGQQLVSESPTKKTRSIVAKLLGVSTGTIQSVSALEKNKPELLEKIDRGEITADQALKQIKASKALPTVSRNRYDDILFSSKGKNDAPKYNLNSLLMNYEGLGEFSLSVSDTSVTCSLNGVSLGEMSQSVRSDYESEGSSLSQHVQSHVFLPGNDKFSIQIIIRDLDQLSHGQMAIAA